MRRSPINVDFGVLVDIISNVAGRMILLACMALLIQQDTPGKQEKLEPTKPISFPLAYMPDKRTVSLALKNGQLFQLPDVEVLQALTAETQKGQPVEWVDLKKNGVSAKVVLTDTVTGFRFLYKLENSGGVPLDNPKRLMDTLSKLAKDHPKDKFFYVIYTWPEEFDAYRDIREYLHEAGIEVGWMPRPSTRHNTWDISYSIGEYSENLTSIKAQ